jgi:hypothetical protein
MLLLVGVWAVTVPVAASLGVLALRAANVESSSSVISPAQAAALTSTASTPPETTAATPTPSPTSTPQPSEVVQRRVPGAVLGLRCSMSVPVLVWSVPDPGWRVDEVDRLAGMLRVRLEADEEEVLVTVACRGASPEIQDADRQEDD